MIEEDETLGGITKAYTKYLAKFIEMLGVHQTLFIAQD